MLVDNNWFEMLKLDNVEQVSGNISRIDNYSLMDMKNTEHKADVEQ